VWERRDERRRGRGELAHARLRPHGHPTITALDNGSTSPNGDPALDLHTAIAEVIVTERRTAIPWSITIRLDAAP
jgi:hypothetical protein